MNLVIGPVVIGIVFGFIVGSRIHMDLKDSFAFSISAILALIIGAIIMAYGLGQYPGYNDFPIATAFLAAVIGILIGSKLLGGRAKGDH